MQKSQFAEEYNSFMEEMDSHYRASPADISRQEQILEEMLRQKPNASAMEKKTWVYRVIASECEIKLFRHCPFYFEVVSGRPRNSVGAAYPPLPGLDSWVMRSDRSGFLEKFQGWVRPYMEEDIIDSTMYMDCAHHGMGVETVLDLGFAGIRKKAEERLAGEEDTQKAEFLNSVIQAQDALIHLTRRFHIRAEEMLSAEEDSVIRKRLERIRDAAEKSPIYPAKTFYEALNTFWYLREIGNTFEALGFAILGHMDRILERYYVQDMKACILTREEAKDLITWFLALTDARWDLNDTPYGTNTSVNIGGCDREGKPVFNDITRFILEAYEEYRFVNPKLQARFSRGAPEEYVRLVGKLAALGTNVLSVFNDEVIIKGETEKGKALEDARLYVNGGCQETVLEGTEFGSRAFCYLNPTKYLLMMLFPEQYGQWKFWNAEARETDGAHPLRCDFFGNEKIVPVSMEHCRDFEEFYERVFYNLKLIVNAITWRYNGFEAFWKDYNPCPLYSSTIAGCVEQAKDVSQGGAKYNGSAFAVSGTGTFIDCLYAIGEAVFHQKRFSLEKMKQMLLSNYEGEETIRRWLLQGLDKYGQNRESLKELTRKVYDDLAVTVSGMPNSRGGQYEAALWSFYGYEWLKDRTGATPDGRKAGESLSRGINPGEHVETTIVQMVHSLSEVDLSKYPGTAVFYFEMPVTLAKQDSRIFEYLIRYFLACKGNVFDFDVVDSRALEDALVHPERHQNLVVRVCGYSARFVTLDKKMQMEILNRSKRITG